MARKIKLTDARIGKLKAEDFPAVANTWFGIPVSPGSGSGSGRTSSGHVECGAELCVSSPPRGRPIPEVHAWAGAKRSGASTKRRHDRWYAMARKIKLTDARIGKLNAEDVEYMVWDTRIAGFGVRVRPTGHKSYVYHRHAEGQSRKFTLGPVALGSVDKARHDCIEVWGRMQSGKRVEGADGAQAPLFRDFVAGSWRAACYEPCKQSTKTSKDWALNNQLLPVFGAMPLDRIDRTGVIRWFEGYSATAPGGANSALLVLRQIMNHAVARGHIETNPTRGLKRNPRLKLTRFLSREEIGRLHEVLDRYEARWPSSKVQADIIRLLLMTGCRKSEVLNLRWREVEGDTLDLEDSKTGPRQVLLSLEARAIIERQPRSGSSWVFPSPSDPTRARTDLGLWKTVRKLAGIEDVRLHDLRHTFASQAAMQGIPLPVVARLLGHAQVQMTLRYAHVSDRDVEAAAERIGGVMAGIMNRLSTAEQN